MLLNRKYAECGWRDRSVARNIFGRDQPIILSRNRYFLQKKLGGSWPFWFLFSYVNGPAMMTGDWAAWKDAPTWQRSLTKERMDYYKFLITHYQNLNL